MFHSSLVFRNNSLILMFLIQSDLLILPLLQNVIHMLMSHFLLDLGKFQLKTFFQKIVSSQFLIYCRNCIGQKFAMMEEKVVVSSILRRFNMSSNLDWNEVKLLPEIILRPMKGIPVQLSPRTSAI